MLKLKFSGHESFICKEFWLRKGMDFVLEKSSFSAEDAVVKLGVGKNMVASIRYWLRAFGLIDGEDQPTKMGDFLLGKEGRDRYLEHLGSIWLLHYLLVSTEYASTYHLVFNDFQIGRALFTQDQLLRYLAQKSKDNGDKTSETSIGKDVAVFLRSYLRPSARGAKRFDIEEEFTKLLIDLDLVRRHEGKDSEGKKEIWYEVLRGYKDSLPWEIVLFSILDQMESREESERSASISFDEVYKGLNYPGLVFGLDEEALAEKIREAVDEHSVRYSETAGNRMLEFEAGINKWEVLDGYFNK